MKNLKSLFRKTSVETLRTYFADRTKDFPKDFDWSLEGLSLANALDTAIAELPDNAQDSLRAELDMIADLAERDGWQSIDDVCRGAGVELDDGQGEFDAAFFIALNHHELFERALAAASLKRGHGGRQWSSYGFMSTSQAAADLADPDARNEFVAKAREILNVPSSRKSEDDWFEIKRIDPSTGEPVTLSQMTLYVEERPQSALAFVGKSIKRRLSPRILELGFIYSPREKLIEICAGGGKEQRGKYADAFAKCLIGEDAEPHAVDRRDVEFLPLQQRPEFVIISSDRIAKCGVSKLRFWNDGSFLQVDKKDDDPGIYDFLDYRFGDRSPLRAPGWKIVGATIKIVREPEGGTGRKKTLTIDLGSPNRTTLRSKTNEDREFANMLMERWGILQPPEPLDETAE